MKFAEDFNRTPFPYNPALIDYLCITHAHMDHIGKIPKLVRDGFRGTIYSTSITRELASVMLADALTLLENEAKREGVLPLYEKTDIDKAFSMWKDIRYHENVEIRSGLSVYFRDAGHILGSAIIEITSNGKKVVFTGDLGNSPALFLRDSEEVTDADYMVMESVYGDRNHESKEERKEKLQKIIKDTILRKRTLIIPAFSLERTQDILYEINELVENKTIEPVPVFIDSPLATKVTEIYKRNTKEFKESAKELVSSGDDPFDFPKLKFTVSRNESERAMHHANPKIIIAGSGMSVGGRVLQYESKYLPDKNATILLVGYQSVGSLGRKLLDGAKKVVIFDQEVSVCADIQIITGYSSHKDSDHLIEFVEKTASTVKKVFVAMGEPKASMFLVQRLRDYLGVDAVYPKLNETVELI